MPPIFLPVFSIISRVFFIQSLPQIDHGSAAMASGATFALLAEPGVAGAIALRFLTGIALAGVYPPAIKLMATWFQKGRGLALGFLIGALTLTYQPSYLDILPLYIVLLALFPAIYCAVRISPLLTLACSLAIWQAALAFELNLPNGSAGVWFFNPFAWQVVFTLGIVIGRAAQLADQRHGVVHE